MLHHSFTGIAGGFSTLSVDISGLLANAISNGDNYLSFGLRTTDTDRYNLEHTIGGVTSKPHPNTPATFIEIPVLPIPEPTTAVLGLLAIGGLAMRRRRTS